MHLETLEFATGPEPTACVIVLHGLGADGHDFVPLCEEMDLSPIGAVRYVFPHALVGTGAQFNEAQLKWGEAVKGKAIISMRMDLPA